MPTYFLNLQSKEAALVVAPTDLFMPDTRVKES